MTKLSECMTSMDVVLAVQEQRDGCDHPRRCNHAHQCAPGDGTDHEVRHCWACGRNMMDVYGLARAP